MNKSDTNNVKDTAVRFCGRGGQGVILAANMLAESLSRQLRHASTVASYGPEARGTTVRADVCASEQWVAYPRVEKPTYVIAMAQNGYDEALHDAINGARILYDPATVKPARREGVEHKAINASQLSEDGFGRSSNANLIMLGAASEFFAGIDFEVLSKTVWSKIANADSATRALKIGREAALETSCE